MYFSTNEKGDFCDFAMQFYKIATTFSSESHRVYDRKTSVRRAPYNAYYGRRTTCMTASVHIVLRPSYTHRNTQKLSAHYNKHKANLQKTPIRIAVLK